MEDLRISASNLGLFVMPDFCERCAWLMLKMSHRFAFQRPFPGILQYLDRLQKAIVHHYIDKYGKLPEWFGPYADAEGYLDTGKLSYTDPETGIELRGVPDEVLVRPDGSLTVVDYKTARHKDGKDVLFPKYVAQLNVYAHLLNQQEEDHAVSKAGLLYFQVQPHQEYEDDELLDLMTEEGLIAHFKAVPLEIKLEPDKMVPELLKKARKLFDRRTPPKGREGCKDCELLARMARLAKLGELKDQSELERFIDFQLKCNFGNDGNVPNSNPEGLIALWDFDDEV